MACSNVSLPSGVRVISTCGMPAAAVPSFSPGSLSWSCSCLGSTEAGPVLSSTFTGVSSVASTSSAASAASIAASNPAFPSRAATREAALSTHPADTATPSSMPMT
jgi:hypothetical protein